MASPSDRKYSESHEWHKLEDDTLTLGVSQFAVDELTDITYAEMKPTGTTVEPGGTVGEIESVKATADVYSAVGGEIIEVNDKVSEDPSILNRDPYEEGWLVKMKVSDPSPIEKLMDSETYDKQHGS